MADEATRDPRAPGWKRDPWRRHPGRYWDGTRWTEHVVSAQRVVSVDPVPDYAPPPPPPPPPPPAPVQAPPDPPREPLPTRPSQPAVAIPDTKRRTCAIVVLVGAAGMAIGAFLPWVKVTAPFVGTISVAGMDGGGDGVFFLVLAALAGLWGLAALNGRVWRRPVAGVVAAIALALDLYEYSHVSSRITNAPDTIAASVGSGIILIGFAAVATLIGVYLMRPTTTNTPASAGGG